jgi:hypothetical protein
MDRREASQGRCTDKEMLGMKREDAIFARRVFLLNGESLSWI